MSSWFNTRWRYYKFKSGTDTTDVIHLHLRLQRGTKRTITMWEYRISEQLLDFFIFIFIHQVDPFCANDWRQPILPLKVCSHISKTLDVYELEKLKERNMAFNSIC